MSAKVVGELVKIAADGTSITGTGVQAAAVAPLASPSFTGTPTVPTAGVGTNTTQAASTAFVAAAIATAITGLLELQGNLDCSVNPSYPAGSKGDTYYVTVAGKIGGVSGISVDVGDAVVCSTDNVGGTQAAVGTSWFVLEHNLVGALLAANNLSDLANAASARTNLGVPSGTGTVSGTNTGDQTTVSGNAGTATALATPRAIYGNNFDGTAALAQVIASTYGGTGNGFAKLSGPATAEKTFTLPNASATILTDNAAVTVAQGGTGRATSTTAYGLLAAGTTATGAQQTLAAGATTDMLVGGGASALPVWTTAQGSGAPVRATSPTLVTPALGTPSALVLTNATGLPVSTGISATGTPSSSTYLRGDGTWAGAAAVADVQIFTASGTWTKPTGASWVEVTAIGGGGGGGSGRRGAAGSIRCGGGGGAGGTKAIGRFPASALGATVAVTVGTGGNGGAARTTDDTSGVNAGAGGDTSFGSLLTAYRGGGGQGGTASTGTSGTSLSATWIGNAGSSASATGGVGSSSFNGGTAGPSPGGAGAGGGITSGDSASAGGAGATRALDYDGAGAGTAGTVGAGQAGGAGGGVTANIPAGGAGGGGGAASITGAAGAGGAGGIYGGGGGGGGASLNGNNSGAGGTGANGIVIVITYF